MDARRQAELMRQYEEEETEEAARYGFGLGGGMAALAGDPDEGIRPDQHLPSGISTAAAAASSGVSAAMRNYGVDSDDDSDYFEEVATKRLLAEEERLKRLYQEMDSEEEEEMADDICDDNLEEEESEEEEEEEEGELDEDVASSPLDDLGDSPPRDTLPDLQTSRLNAQLLASLKQALDTVGSSYLPQGMMEAPPPESPGGEGEEESGEEID